MSKDPFRRPTSRCAIAILVFLSAFATSVFSAGDVQVGKRDLRAARAALEKRAWDESLALYERILESSLADDPGIKLETLYVSTAILLSSSLDEPSLAVADERIRVLSARRGYENELEVRAFSGLLAALRDVQSMASQLENRLASERTGHELARDEEIARAAQAMAAKDRVLNRQRRRNQTLRRENKTLSHQVRALTQRIEDVVADLAQRDADTAFLVGQLQGTQADQQQMLDAVMKKNEELQQKERQLRSMRLALQEKESELDTQAEALSNQEEELRKREEAIREVTDRVLKKGQPGS